MSFQGWNSFFERLKVPVYPVLVKQFWLHATAEKETITSYVMNRKIVITEKSFANLILHNGRGKRIHSAKINAKREAKITSIIFKAGTNLDDDKGPSAKDLINHQRVWFKIILGYIHHTPYTNSSNYVKQQQRLVIADVNIHTHYYLFLFCSFDLICYNILLCC